MAIIQSEDKKDFNPRSREGSDQNAVVCPLIIPHFNPRSREGSDLALFAVIRARVHFNPRSREGSDTNVREYITRTRDFNPRSREGSDSPMWRFCWRSNISIHAPAKGATGSGLPSPSCPRPFQSTLPRRERPYTVIYTPSSHWISIHAPAKGATITPLRITASAGISIHAPAKGATSTQKRWKTSRKISIHAPAKGATAAALATHTCRPDFNPRSREGSDRHAQPLHNLWRISIHAPAKGATCPRPGRGRKDSISIHAPAKGATYRAYSCPVSRSFQSTLPRRERPAGNRELSR